MNDTEHQTSFAEPSVAMEVIHASTVAKEGRALLICGPSGAGKSDLALRLLDCGFALVSDDQTIVRRAGDRLLAAPPAAIAGKLEIRGLGIVEMDFVCDQPVALVVELTSDIQRLPDNGRQRRLLGVDLPLVSIDAMSASAASKVALALNHFGLSL